MKKIVTVIIVLSFSSMLFGIPKIVGAKDKEFPEKPIQLLVGYGPGSVADLAGRAISKVMTKYLEKPLVVVNMPGAATTVALNELAKSAPDGHTIAIMSATYPGLTAHQQRVPFDPKILKPVLGYTMYRHVLYVRADSPYTKLEEFIAYGQKNPSAIKYGHAGRGIVPHLQAILFFRSANIQAVDVPYKSTPDFVQAVVGGHITAGVGDISGIWEQIRAGVLKPVVAFMDQRFQELPDVPTSQEKRYADVSELNNLVVICIHRDTPSDRVNKLHDTLKKTVLDPEFEKMLDNVGLKSKYTSPEACQKNILTVEKMGVPLLKELKLFVE